VSARAGASALAGGAVDDVPWEQRARAARLLALEAGAPAGVVPAPVRELAAALGLWEIPTGRGALLATLAGRIRPARGRDRSLLDLGRLERARVLLPRADRPGWDADALAAALGDEPAALERGLRFEAVDAPILRFDDERRIADGDLAARHDDPARIAWLAARLREALARAGSTGRGAAEAASGAGAILLGPWLGARAARAPALAEAVGVPVGEALAGAGSPAGLRFEAARDALLDAIGAERIRGRAIAIEMARPEAAEEGGHLRISVEGRDAPLAADAVVLAIGGMAGGGVRYTPPEHIAGEDLPPGARVPFALSLAAPVALGDGRAPLELVSSLHGPDLDEVAWPSGDRPGLLESIGVHCSGLLAGPGIFAAGDVVAGRPRTALEAVAMGIRAGGEACR
jgi:glycerol-3-phosphate dehydrogenase subunit B